MKNLWIAILALMVTTLVSGQDIDLGIKGGVNISKVNFDGDTNSITGFVFGGFVGAKFGEKIGLQADLLYSQQGTKIEAEEINLDYVNIPIVLKYYLTDRINIQAGPQFGFVVEDGLSDISEDIKANDFDMSGAVGLGLDLPFDLQVSGRYHFGFSDVSKEADGKNSVITLAVGYSFL